MKGIKKMSFAAMAALAMVSCSNHDAWMSYEEYQAAQYDAAFVQKYGNIDPNHDWGFGSVGTRATRAASTWSWADNHPTDDSWMEALKFEIPEGITKVTDKNYDSLKDSNGRLPDGTYYIGKDFTGTINFKDGFKGNVYVDTEIKEYWGNIGELNLYILEGGSWKCDCATGSTTIYNRGLLTFKNEALTSASKVPVVYNGGTLSLSNEYGNPNIADAVKIYSNGEGLVEINCKNTGEWDLVDLKCTLDIHGKLKVNGNLHIQNDKYQYVCGLEVTGRLYLNKGHLQSSYVKADQIDFEGDALFLLPGGHVVANTIKIPNGGCYVHGDTSSNGLIEVGDITFQNDNDFDRTFSNNIYFNVTGTIDCSGATNLPGGDASKKKYNNAAEYLDQIGGPADRLNAGNATGSPACGEPWTVGEDETITYAKRIICEDLGATDDFDFNDVVFDALIKDGKTYIKLLAAGGTMRLTVAGVEVHEKFGVDVSTMVNTGLHSEEYKEFEVDNDFGGDYAKIPVVVELSGDATEHDTAYELKNTIGGAPKKICVDTDYDWTTERQQIEQKYPKFKDWVGNYSLGTSWYK